MRDYTFLVGSDIHFPVHDRKAVDAFMDEAGSGYDLIVINGDALDMESISTFSDGLPESLVAPIKLQFLMLRDFFVSLRKVAPKSNIVYVLGNHEHRISRWLDRNPSMRGLVEIEDYVPDFVHVVPYESEGYRNGSVTFVHSKGGGNVHSAVKKHAVEYVTHTVIGHFHAFGSYTAPSQVGVVPRTCQAVGTLSKLNHKYMQGRPASAEQGYLTGEVKGSRVQFWPIRL